jgi:hypothetical protein
MVRWWQLEGKAHQWRSAPSYVLITWLALHTHYFALYVVVAQNIVLLGWGVTMRAWHKLMRWGAIGLVLLLLWLPWLWSALPILLGYTGNGDSPTLLAALVRAHSAFGVGESVGLDARPWWALCVLAAMAVGAWLLMQRVGQLGGAALWLLVIYWLVPLAAIWWSAQSRPIFNERYLVAVVPPVYLLMAASLATGWAWPRARWLGAALTVVVLVGMGLGLMRQASGVAGDGTMSKNKGWRELAASLEQMVAGVDPTAVRLVQNYPDPTLWYYYRGEVAHLVLPPTPHDIARTEEEVAMLAAAGVARVILVEQPSAAWDGDALARTALDGVYALGGKVQVASWPVSIWLRPAATFAPLTVDYVDGLQLRGVQVVPATLPAGGMVAIHLHWQGISSMVGAGESVSVQLLNAAGALVAQRDLPLAMASSATTRVASYAILLPDKLPVGDYAVVVVIYDGAQTGEPRRLTLQGADHVVVGQVGVTE